MNNDRFYVDLDRSEYKAIKHMNKQALEAYLLKLFREAFGKGMEYQRDHAGEQVDISATVSTDGEH